MLNVRNIIDKIGLGLIVIGFAGAGLSIAKTMSSQSYGRLLDIDDLRGFLFVGIGGIALRLLPSFFGKGR
ncbi:hypothetical protein TRP8649_03260 [Pelagimonas phthalicica]|uniref:Uncharacterized protein n=1 Tax=Pelagimonas phthalicica TaxID=1037362 RepID=A0A238JEP3_9RHOB|nr:hypothetical protein [Pelagimonas phthalicica]TDS92078.1 hypothetical protein CLV87_3260 [Pelagimonas phthalicica]SMX29128.1 hypothetical protein TRP8649_03260 [Pelagimonas phthalicica]